MQKLLFNTFLILFPYNTGQISTLLYYLELDFEKAGREK